MAAFATVSDLESRWRTLDTDEQEKAGTLLDDAAAMLAAFVTVDTSDTAQAELLKIVSCNMVIRSMSASETDAYGASQMSMTAGPYTRSYTFGNPSGDLYLTKLEKRMLGITGSYIGSLEAAIDGYYGDNDD